jgi:hypothetical protein
MFSRTARSRSDGQTELYSFGGTKRSSRAPAGRTRNTSEESILGAEGIIKTVETRIEEDYMRDSVQGKYGETQGYNGVQHSEV